MRAHSPVSPGFCFDPSPRDGEAGANLSCGREGFFIAGFEQAGVFSGSQGAAFPLSSALCCRPCFDASDPASRNASAQVAAIISVGCTQSVWTDAGQKCPGDTLVSGYSSARLGNPIHRFYPVGPALCCRPGALLHDGTVQLLKRCAQCAPPAAGNSEVSCGGFDNVESAVQGGTLLAGWAGVLKQTGAVAGVTDVIPLAPAECCGVCLDPAEVPRELPCEAAIACSGHGSCGAGGHCVCDEGWGGPACTDGAPPTARSLLTSTPTLIGAAAAASLCAVCMAVRAALLSRSLAAARRAALLAALARRSELEAPLLASSSSDDEDEVEWRGSVASDTESESDEDEQRPLLVGEPAAATGYVPPMPAEVEADAVAEVVAEAVADVVAEAEAVPLLPAAKDAELCPPKRGTPECVLCMDASVTRVFIPCGHACACRSCSKRCRRCPICRMVVTHRQRLFLST